MFSLEKYTFLAVLIFVRAISLKDIKDIFKPNCDQYTTQLTNLLRLMCTNIANGDINNVIRDACIGCFNSAVRSNNNQPSMAEIRACSERYLADTRYMNCVGISQNIADATSSNDECPFDYCNFVRCVRRTNADLLIAQCFADASIDNDADLEEDQVIFYKNVTSCILATVRCSPINPITGQPQTSSVTTTSYNKLGKPVTSSLPLYNSLQINQAGDLRIIAFPGTMSVQKYFCPIEYNLRDSTWRGFTC